MYCPECGKDVPDGAKFCVHCRHDLRRFAAATVVDRTGPEEALPVFGDRYEVRGELGRGGMGVVYRAWDRRLEMEVSLKVLPPELSHDERAVRRLREEARAAMRLAHPNIVRLHNLEESPEGTFLVMELVGGPSLAALLARAGPLPVDRVLALASPVCSGLDYAHHRRVIHRDVKSANILLEADGTPKITDFGIARIVRETMSRLTRVGTAGTLVYMSPEQLAGKEIDKRTDIYALGATLYELLTGHPPFWRGGIEYQIREEKPAPLDGVPENVNRAILRALEKRPDDRYESAGAFAAALGESRPIVIVPAPVPAPAPAARPEPESTPAPTMPPQEPELDRAPAFPTDAGIPVAIPASEPVQPTPIAHEPVVVGPAPPVAAPEEPKVEERKAPVVDRPSVEPAITPFARRRKSRWRTIVFLLVIGGISYGAYWYLGKSEREAIGALESIRIGGEARGRFARPGDEKPYRLEIEGGSDAEIVVEALADEESDGPALTPLLEIRPSMEGDPVEGALGTPGGIAAVARTWGSGPYVVVVKSAGGSGRFRVRVAPAPPEIDFPSVVEGRIDAAKKTVGYLLRLRRKQSIAISVAGTTDELDPALLLTDPAARPIESDDDGADGHNATIIRTLPAGIYHISVQSYMGTAGAFALRVAPVNAIEPGGRVAGEIEKPGQRDWHVLRIARGGEYEILAESSDDRTVPRIEVFPPGADEPIAIDHGKTATGEILQTALALGDYRIMARLADGGEPGEYTIRANAGAKPVAYDATIEGDATAAPARFRFALAARTRLEMRIAGRNGWLPVVTIRWAGDGPEVFSSHAIDPDLAIAPTLEPGRYEIAIGGTDNGGPFALTIARPTPTIDLGGRVAGTFGTRGARASYRIALTRPTTVAIRMIPRAAALYPRVSLLGADGTVYTAVDGDGATQEALIVRTLGAGLYDIVATARDGSGSYEVSASEVQTDARVQPGSIPAGSLSYEQPAKVYEINLDEDTPLVLELSRTSGSIRPALGLFRDDGEFVAFERSATGSVVLKKTVPPGRYRILVASEHPERIGSFRLSIGLTSYPRGSWRGRRPG